jgi:hypothetical protein
MKNIFKSRFSLITICIILGILIGSFVLCGCRRNYGLIEGYTEGATAETEGASSTSELTNEAKALAGDVKNDMSVKNILKDTGVSDLNVTKTFQGLGSNLESSGNAFTKGLGTALKSWNPASGIVPKSSNEVKVEDDDEDEDEDTAPAPAAAAAATTKVTKTEGFRMSRPLEWGPIKENENDNVNLSQWVSNAMKYSKGMGNENKLDSYQYNSGPQIPLPEGQLFYFKDTKFNPSCCPSTYTNSMGCACLSKKQLQYLTMRGGNNTIPNNKTSYFNEF